MLEIDTNIKKQFNDVISYSQDNIEVNTDFLFENWSKNKEYFYNRILHQNLIYNVGEISISLSEEAKQNMLKDFLSDLPWFNDNYNKMGTFIEENGVDGFFSNTVVINYNINGKNLKGMRLSKAFKFFIEDKEDLDEWQTKASMLIQNNKLEGELCFSIHPLDFLSLSENLYNWRSCHALDGEYKAGNLSYMGDSTTMICYIKGKNDVILPRFPEDVPWNNKKWRMLLFFSEGKSCLMAGRQYPFDLGKEMLKIITDKLNLYYWSDWYNDQITTYKYQDEDYRQGLNSPHVIIHGNILPIKKIVKDCKPALHYNDLLYSSCYVPYYSWSYGSHTIPNFKVGEIVKCLSCNSETLNDSSYVVCRECRKKLGLGGEYKCNCCGQEFDDLDDLYWIDCTNEYVCENCLNEKYVYCPSCGEYYLIDDCYYDEVTEEYYCSDCYHSLLEERNKDNND